RNAGAEHVTQSVEGGAFAFPAVRVAEWELLATVKRNGVELMGLAKAIVTRSDLECVEIRLARPFTVQGLVDREEPRDAKGERKVTGVFLVPAGALHAPTASVFHKQDGSFAIPGVYPGRYLIHPAGFVPGYYLESVKLGDREVLEREI